MIVCDLSVDEDESYCVNGVFVHNCRSALALVTEADVADELTGRMQSAARAEIGSRERGEGVTTAPSNALRGG